MDYNQRPPDWSPKTNLQSPNRLTPKTPIDRGRRPPRLILPTPNVQNNGSPRPPSLLSAKSSNPNGTPYLYPERKQSEFVTGLKGFAKSGLSVGEKSTLWLYHKLSSWSKKWFTHCFLSIVLGIYTLLGALIFVAVEGEPQAKLIESSRQDRYELITDLRELAITLPILTSEGEWQAQANIRLKAYEEKVIRAHESKIFLINNGGGFMWTFFNSLVYCATVYTTIGYGHMVPETITGKAITIVYAIIGIPLFLIALTDFGKLFTRCIKFLWSYVRRVYYTGSCRTVRKTAHVEDILQGAQIMYEIATLRRPSMFANIDPASLEEDPENPKTKDGAALNSAGIGSDTPTTPAPSNFEIDDEFNLPISVAIFILVLYIFLGAVMYWTLEEKWDFFASFYFVFISMSTIGFGDYVPRHPVCMIASIVYLVFGLALMSMCINVVQVKLSDTFKDASQKLGATIGLGVEEEEEEEEDMDGEGDGSINAAPTSVTLEVPDVNVTEEKENEAKDKDKDKDKKNGKNGKKEKKSSMKVKNKDEKKEKAELDVDDVDVDVDKPRTPKVKF